MRRAPYLTNERGVRPRPFFPHQQLRAYLWRALLLVAAIAIGLLIGTALAPAPDNAHPAPHLVIVETP